MIATIAAAVFSGLGAALSQVGTLLAGLLGLV